MSVFARSPPTCRMPTPTKSAKMMMGRMSALAMEAIGFAGIIATSTCMRDGAFLTSTAASLVMLMPMPGWKSPATAKPMRMAMAVVQR